MPASYRDVYVILRARDEASRVLQRAGSGFGKLAREAEAANKRYADVVAKSQANISAANQRFTEQTTKANTSLRNSLRAIDRQALETSTNIRENLTRNAAQLKTSMREVERNTTAATRAIEDNVRRGLQPQQRLLKDIGVANAKHSLEMTKNSIKLQSLTGEERRHFVDRNNQLRTYIAENRVAAAQANRRMEIMRQESSNQLQFVKRLAADQKMQLREVAAAEENLQRVRQNNLRAHTASAKLNARERADVAKQTATQERDAIRTLEQARQRAALSERNLTQQRIAMHQQAGQRVATYGQATMITGILLTAMGAKGVSAFNSMANAAMEFDRQSRRTQTQAVGLNASLQQMKDIAHDVGRDIAAPFEELQPTLYSVFSSMNVNVSEARSLLRGFAQEAVAGQTDMIAVMRSSVAMMNAFGLGAKDLERIQDMQFQTVRKGILTYEELSANIGKIIPSAARAGQSIETMGAFLAFMTRQGMSAAMSATSVARGMEAFAEPATVRKIEDMGIAVRDGAGEFRNMIEVVTELGEKMSSLPGPESATVLKDLLMGSGSSRIQALRLWQLSIKNFEELRQHMQWQMDNSGAFREAYNIMAEGPAAQLQRLHNHWQSLKITMGEEVLPIKIALMEKTLQLVQSFINLDEATRNNIIRFTLFAAATAAVVGPMMVMGGLMVTAIGMLMGLGKSFGVATLIVGGMPVAIMAIVAAIGLLIFHFDTVKEMASSFADAMKRPEVQVALLTIGTWAAIAAILKFEGVLGAAAVKVSVFRNQLVGLQAVMMRFAKAHPILLALTATAIVLGKVFWDNAQRAKEVAAATRDYADALASVEANSKDYIAAQDESLRTALETRLAQEGIHHTLKNLRAELGNTVPSYSELNRIMSEAAIAQNGVTTELVALNSVLHGTSDNHRVARDVVLEEVEAYDALIARLADLIQLGVMTPSKWKTNKELKELIEDLGREKEALKDSPQLWMDRARAQGGATYELAKYAEILRRGGPVSQAEGRFLAAIQGGAIAADELGEAISNLPPELRQYVDGIDGAAEATEGALEAMTRLTPAQESLKSAIQALLSPANAWTSALEKAQEAARKWAENTYKDSENMSEKVEEHVAKARVSLQGWREELDAQVTAYRNFTRNLTALSAAGFGDVIQQIVDMGEAGPQAAQMLVEGLRNGDKDATAILENLREQAFLLEDSLIQHIEAGMQGIENNIRNARTPTERESRILMTALATSFEEGGKTTVAGLARQLDIGYGEVLKIMRKYNMSMVVGLNPILTALGKQEIHMATVAAMHGIRTVGGLNKGGYVPGVGPDRDTVLAALTTGEYVLRRSTVRNLDIQSLNEFNTTGNPLALFNRGGFVDEHAVPKPPSYSSVSGWPLDMVAGKVSGRLYDDVFKWVKENAAPPLGTGVGWQAMWAAVSKKFPGIGLHSAFRPGARTATGRPSYHGMGRAIDISPMMAAFNWIAKHYPHSRELIFSPAGNRQIHNGRNHMYSGITRAMHFDHIHWAMANGGIVNKPLHALIGERGPEAVLPLDRFAQLMEVAMTNALRSLPLPPRPTFETINAPGRLGRSELDYFKEVEAQIKKVREARNAAAKGSDERREFGQQLDSLWREYRAAQDTISQNKELMRVREMDVQQHIDHLTKKIDAEVRYSADWLRLVDERNAVIASELQRRQQIEDNMFQLGVMNGREYLRILDERIAAETAYTNEWMGLYQRRQEVYEQIKNQVRDLTKSVLENERAMLNAARTVAQLQSEINQIHMGPTAQQHLDVIRAEQSLREAEKTLVQLRSGPTAQQRLDVLRQQQAVEELAQKLSDMRTGVPSNIDELHRAEETLQEAQATLSRAEADLALAKFEHARLNQVADHIQDYDEITALLMRFEAAAGVADAEESMQKAHTQLGEARDNLDEVRRKSQVTARDLVMAELELQIVTERLTELEKNLTATTEDLTIAQYEVEIATDRLDEARKALTLDTEALRLKEIELQLALMELADLQRQAIELSKELAKARRDEAGATNELASALRALKDAQNLPGKGAGGGGTTPQQQLANAKTTATRVTASPSGGSAAGQLLAVKAAKGAIVRARSGGSLIWAGEAGQDEAITPLPRNWQRDGIGGGLHITFSDGAFRVTIEGDADAEDVEDGVSSALDKFVDDLYDTLRGR